MKTTLSTSLSSRQAWKGCFYFAPNFFRTKLTTIRLKGFIKSTHIQIYTRSCSRIKSAKNTSNAIDTLLVIIEHHRLEYVRTIYLGWKNSTKTIDFFPWTSFDYLQLLENLMRKPSASLAVWGPSWTKPAPANLI